MSQKQKKKNRNNNRCQKKNTCDVNEISMESLEEYIVKEEEKNALHLKWNQYKEDKGMLVGEYNQIEDKLVQEECEECH